MAPKALKILMVALSAFVKVNEIAGFAEVGLGKREMPFIQEATSLVLVGTPTFTSTLSVQPKASFTVTL